LGCRAGHGAGRRSGQRDLTQFGLADKIWNYGALALAETEACAVIPFTAACIGTARKA
jgi:hypothetical protein